MVMLNLPITYDLLDISNADIHEIARLPIEFFQPQNWDSTISTMNTMKVINLLADDKVNMDTVAKNIDFYFRYSPKNVFFKQYLSKDGIFPRKESFWLLLRDGVIKCPLDKLKYLLIDVSYKSIKMLDQFISMNMISLLEFSRTLIKYQRRIILA